MEAYIDRMHKESFKKVEEPTLEKGPGVALTELVDDRTRQQGERKKRRGTALEPMEVEVEKNMTEVDVANDLPIGRKKKKRELARW